MDECEAKELIDILNREEVIEICEYKNGKIIIETEDKEISFFSNTEIYVDISDREIIK